MRNKVRLLACVPVAVALGLGGASLFDDDKGHGPEGLLPALPVPQLALSRTASQSAKTAVREFLDDLRTGDLDKAERSSTEYARAFTSARELATDPLLKRLATENVEMTVNPSWSFSAPMPIVTVSTLPSSRGGLAAAAILVDSEPEPSSNTSPALIHRIQQASDSAGLRMVVNPGKRVDLPGFPVEGGVRVFLDDQEIPVAVDFDKRETWFIYPSDSVSRILTVSFASPELAGSTAYVLDVAE